MGMFRLLEALELTCKEGRHELVFSLSSAWFRPLVILMAVRLAYLMIRMLK